MNMKVIGSILKWVLIWILAMIGSLILVAFMFELYALTGGFQPAAGDCIYTNGDCIRSVGTSFWTFPAIMGVMLSTLVPGTLLILAWKMPGLIVKGSYLVFLNNNLRQEQMPYSFKSFLVLTALEDEAKKVMGNRR